jgi:hypothetical protein
MLKAQASSEMGREVAGLARRYQAERVRGNGSVAGWPRGSPGLGSPALTPGATHAPGKPPTLWQAIGHAALVAGLTLIWTFQSAAVGPVPSREQIEADWFRQDEVRNPRPKVAPEEDALGGCDGIKNGQWGFHTAMEDNPWWQVDLGQTLPLNRLRIYNRCDHTANRAVRLKVLRSEDGTVFRQAYEHDGTTFHGAPDGKPLIIQLKGEQARYVRIQVPGRNCLHLDEIEVYAVGGESNVALGKPATQSSVCEWSTRKARPGAPRHYPTGQVVERGLRLEESLCALGSNTEGGKLRELGERSSARSDQASDEARRSTYLEARWSVRKLALRNPLLDFDDLLFATSAPGRWSHMSDQYLGWWSQPGGGLCVLEHFKSDQPRVRTLTAGFAPGNVLRPDISYDGKQVLFAWCRYYPGLSEQPDKLDKAKLPEDSFYHLFEMNLDGTGLRQLTRGKYNDFDGRYLPDGRIVFCSTRRGVATQYTRVAAGASLTHDALPEAYVRCGGGPERPCAVYTLHTMDRDGGNLTPISAFEMFEWTPSVDNQGRILYSRWDYVDRFGQNAMGLWSTLPDGTGAQAVFGNFTRNPECMFEPRSIPGSAKLVFTAAGHHSITAGSLVLLDPTPAADAPHGLTRLTPEVPFPESEGRPDTFYANPYPFSEEHYLVAWSDRPLKFQGEQNDTAALGVYLYDAFGNLNLLYRDPAMGSQYPLPIRPRSRPPQISPQVKWNGPQEAEMLLLNVSEGLGTIPPGTIKRLRIVGMPLKTHPTMDSPSIGLTTHDSGRFVLGTVPVEPDGSAYFRVPSGITFFLQALDAEGMAVQTMRSATYLQPGQSYTCIGCHEHRRTAPANAPSLAARRPASKLTPGPIGSWPLDYASLIQPVLDRQCIHCHQPGAEDEKFDLTRGKSYERLVNYGSPSLKDIVVGRYKEQRSQVGACEARVNPMLKLLRRGHYEVRLAGDDWDRLITWMDTLGQRVGHFSPEQEQELRKLRLQLAGLMNLNSEIGLETRNY